MPAARRLERPGCAIAIVGSIVDLIYLLNSQDGLSHQCRVHMSLARVLAPCTLHGDSYHQR